MFQVLHLNPVKWEQGNGETLGEKGKGEKGKGEGAKGE
jgi:hypothetical protein